jgi:hypothetical protein
MARRNKQSGNGLRLDVLPPAQRALWDRLDETPSEFVLFGGTAIALRLGHRQSVDFDFFAYCDIDPDRLLAEVGYLKGAEVVRRAPNTLTCRVRSPDIVSVSFVGLPNLHRVQPPEQLAAPALRLASMTDLSGTKMVTVTQRAEAKDYRDVHAILTMTRISLLEALAAAFLIYGPQYNPLTTLKALTYFGEPQLAALPAAVKRDLRRHVAVVDLAMLPDTIERLKGRTT